MHLIAQSSQSSPLSFLIFLLPLGLLFYLMRAQRRRVAQQTELQRSAEVGDEIITTNGMFGTVVSIDDDDTITLEIAPGTRVRMIRSGIGRVLTEDEDEEDEDDSAWDEGDEEADSPS